MPTYRVLIPWTNDDGEHQPGDTVDLPTETPAEQVEADRLINYGIVEPTSDTTTPAAKRSSRK